MLISGLNENVKMSLHALRSNKMRSLLTMLGIIIGIASVIAIMSLGDATVNSVQDEMEAMGMSSINVSVREAGTTTTLSRVGRTQTQTPKDSDMMTQLQIDSFKIAFASKIAGVSLQQAGDSGEIKANNRSAKVTTSGINHDYLLQSSTKVLFGRWINDADVSKSAKVAVISDKAAAKLFGNPDSVGKTVMLSSGDKVESYAIVGVYKYVQSALMMGPETEMPTSFYIPVSTAKQSSTNKNFSSITVIANKDADTTALGKEIETYFNTKFYSHNPKWEVGAFAMATAMEQISEMMGSMSTAIAVIAGISLIVGGIGIMNIMLVSVTERTREIGIRKALGARRNAIRMQFVIEAIVVSVIGGLIGAALGIALAYIACNLLKLNFSFDIEAVMISVGFSAAIGLFFGYYPANKASKLDPIEALRYE